MRNLVREAKIHEVIMMNAIRRFQLQSGLLGCEGSLPDVT